MSNFIEDFTNAFNPSFSRKLKNFLNDYGELQIVGVFISRVPIDTKLLLDLISLGKFSTITNAYYDELYHLRLYLVCIDRKGKIYYVMIEKNEVINISILRSIEKLINESEHLEFELDNIITLNELIKRTLERIGNEDFFEYSFEENNCQKFVLELLKTLNEENNIPDDIIKFVFQDPRVILESGELDNFSKIAKALIGIAAFGRRIIGGE